jgi:hypothetical protein
MGCLYGFLLLVLSGTAQAQKLDGMRLFPNGGMRGTSVSIALPGKFDAWPIAIWSSSPQIQWQATETSGTISATIASDAPVGVHFVRLHHASAASPLLRFVVGDRTEVLEVEPNDLFSQPQMVDVANVTIQGVLQKSGDVDHFAVPMVAGQKLSMDVDAQRSLRSPMDACLQLLDTQGNILAQNLDRFGLDPGLEFVCPRDGHYILRVFAFPETPDSTIGYAGGDAFAYRLHCTIGDNPAWESSFSADAILIEEPSERGMPTPLASLIGTPGSGRVSLHGVLDSPRDEDAVQLETTQPGHWNVQLKALEFGSDLDGVLEILDASGKSLAKQGETGAILDPVLTNQMAAPGKYTLVVRDLHGRGGPAFRYRLELIDEAPTVKGTVGADVLTGSIGQAIEVEVALERTFDCPDEATVRIVGLPEGATCEPVVSKAKEDSAKKVKLTIDAKAACSVPIQIVVERMGLGNEPVQASPSKEPHLWLVVPPA